MSGLGAQASAAMSGKCGPSLGGNGTAEKPQDEYKKETKYYEA